MRELSLFKTDSAPHRAPATEWEFFCLATLPFDDITAVARGVPTSRKLQDSRCIPPTTAKEKHAKTQNHRPKSLIPIIALQQQHWRTHQKSVHFRLARVLGPDLELASLGDVLDALERLVLLAVHVQSVHLQPRHGQLVDRELDRDRRTRICRCFARRAARLANATLEAVNRQKKNKLDFPNVGLVKFRGVGASHPSKCFTAKFKTQTHIQGFFIYL